MKSASQPQRQKLALDLLNSVRLAKVDRIEQQTRKAQASGQDNRSAGVRHPLYRQQKSA